MRHLLQLLKGWADLAFFSLELLRVSQQVVKETVNQVFKFILHFGAFGLENIVCACSYLLHSLNLLI